MGAEISAFANFFGLPDVKEAVSQASFDYIRFGKKLPEKPANMG